MIGIFGGTFDPVHYGHLRSALEVKGIFGLDEVRLIPCANPPHREQPAVTADMRLQMLELAIKNQPGLKIDTRELDRYQESEQAPSFMVDTLKSLRQEFPAEPLLLFIGSDAFKHLTGWHQWQRLFDYAHIVVMTRPGFETQALDDFFKARLAGAKELAQATAGKLCFQQVTQLDISATAIRDMIARKLNPGFLLPDAVIEYIKQHQLYETR
ncbi:nicotinate-nucleotide adenylyltransferase [Methylobacter svalbardensis]|uniref:nicotinate-nucleotide adenylyltransferase n=1 Tax=Methylobacter svalbardensis TaxID=3080016 RepID=UPI0030ED623E